MVSFRILNSWRTLQFAASLVLLWTAAPAFAGVQAQPAPAEPESGALPAGAVALVNGEVITIDAFRDFYAAYVAQNYYHNSDEGRREEVARDALDMLVSDAILLQEAKRRGIKGDPEKAAERLAALEKRFARDEESRKSFEEKRENLKEEILNDTRVEALHEAIIARGAPTEDEIKRFYEEHADLFTTPPAVDLSIILRPVPPHGVTQEWKTAATEAEALHARLVAGEGFDALARESSGHPSSEDGGALGLLHKGQLVDVVTEAIANLAAGEFTPPVRLLEGIAIFKVNARVPASLQNYDDVKERASALFARTEEERLWREFLDGLRAGARIKTATSPVSLLRDN